MSCFDCSKAVPKICKADCCGIVPINHLVYYTMQDKIVRHPLFTFEMQVGDENFITPVTEDGICPFLNKNYQCNIYEHRPEVCKQFGFVEEMQCPHMKGNGEFRTVEEKKELEKKTENYQVTVINKLKSL